MKKLLVLLLICTFALPALPSRASNRSSGSGSEVGPIITLHIEFGRRSKGCKGIGICNISAEWGEEMVVHPGAAWGTARVENGHLLVELDRNSIEAGTLQTYFGANLFKMEEDYVLPPEVAKALGVSGYTVKTGSYTVAQDAGKNTLSLSL